MEEADEVLEGGGVYENGHWAWNEKTNSLEFISVKPQVLEDKAVLAAGTAENVNFRDDIDVFEQIRFRRYYQRKIRPGEPDVIALQDVKDLALYTAPIGILSSPLIDLLHQTTTERFIRALILYCQYYLQVMAEMNRRKIESISKIRTSETEAIEEVYKENLSDLRLLVGKEYSVLLIGGSDLKRFHHMGEKKNRKSLMTRDARLFETFFKMCIQIVWLALGRKSFNQLELEIHRIFKSDMFNSIEHRLKTGFIEKMTPQERNVLLGKCLHRRDKKMVTRSPLSHEIFCSGKDVDFTMMGLGAIAYRKLTARVNYLASAIAAPEDMLLKLGVTVGIIGMDRNKFDIMLRPLPSSDKSSRDNKFSSSSINFRRLSSGASRKKMTESSEKAIYPDVVLPVETRQIEFPPTFPEHLSYITTCCYVQRNLWQKRLKTLLAAMKRCS